jgi:hypothetical protein
MINLTSVTGMKLAPRALFIPTALFSRLSRDEALLLAYLVWWEAQGTTGELKWFVCPQEQIRRTLGYSISAQTRLMRQLDEKFCLETQRIGFPGARHIRLVRHPALKIMREFQQEEKMGRT